jgi:UPF0755 protein
MRSSLLNRPSSTDTKKGWGCSYLFGCIFVTFAACFMGMVMLSMVPQVREFTRAQIRKLAGKHVESVTIPEGWNRFQIASRLANKGVIGDPQAFLSATQDRSILEAHGIGAETAEGYLFPDTYEFYRGSEPEVIVDVFLSNFNEKWKKVSLNKAGLTTLAKLGDDPKHVAVILASIVEKEAVKKSEKPIIAGVFLNRLISKPFPSRLLQADPTVSYGCVAGVPLPDSCGGFSGKLARRHLEDDTNPYNTYVHQGLPPGPIANPGMEALEAVLDPAETDYLYFMSRGNGTHKFSKTLKQHSAAVKKYREGGK